MQGGITNIASLKTWFYTTGKPFFTLRYYKPGSAGEVIARNKQEDDMAKAWELLEANVLGQTANTRALLQVFVYDQGKENNYTALTNLDMQPAAPQTAVAGIGSLYGHYGSIDAAVAAAKEKWELERRIEDLETALEAPKDWGEQIAGIFERISSTPAGNVLIARVLGVAVAPPVAAPIAGTPKTGAEEDDTFEEDLAAVSEHLGVSDTEVMAKLRRLVEAQPEMAKQILNNI